MAQIMSCRLPTVLALLTLASCAGQGVTRTGFLSSYDGMAPTPDHTKDLIFVDPGYARLAYSKVVIEPVAWVPAPDTPARDPQTINELKAAFRQSLVENLSKDFTIIEPGSGETLGPGVLRVRAAITNTRRANWWINAPVQVIGIGLQAVGVPGGAPPPNPGGASVEMEAVDAATNKSLVAIATYNNGVPWAPLGYYQEFGHARRAFRNASSLLREQMAGNGQNREGQTLSSQAIRTGL